MANIQSARKRARQSEVRRLRNKGRRTAVRSHIKRVRKAIAAGDKAGAEVAYKEAVPAIDKAVTRGVMHRNQAARHKSRLNRHLREL